MRLAPPRCGSESATSTHAARRIASEVRDGRIPGHRAILCDIDRGRSGARLHRQVRIAGPLGHGPVVDGDRGMSQPGQGQGVHGRRDTAAAIDDDPGTLEGTDAFEQGAQLLVATVQAVRVQQGGIGDVATALDVALAAIVDVGLAAVDPSRQGAKRLRRAIRSPMRLGSTVLPATRRTIHGLAPSMRGSGAPGPSIPLGLGWPLVHHAGRGNASESSVHVV